MKQSWSLWKPARTPTATLEPAGEKVSAADSMWANLFSHCMSPVKGWSPQADTTSGRVPAARTARLSCCAQGNFFVCQVLPILFCIQKGTFLTISMVYGTQTRGCDFYFAQRKERKTGILKKKVLKQLKRISTPYPLMCATGITHSPVRRKKAFCCGHTIYLDI